MTPSELEKMLDKLYAIGHHTVQYPLTAEEMETVQWAYEKLSSRDAEVEEWRTKYNFACDSLKSAETDLETITFRYNCLETENRDLKDRAHNTNKHVEWLSEKLTALEKENEELRMHVGDHGCNIVEVTRERDEMVEAVQSMISQSQKECVKEGCTCVMNIGQLILAKIGKVKS